MLIGQENLGVIRTAEAEDWCGDRWTERVWQDDPVAGFETSFNAHWSCGEGIRHEP